MEHASTICYAAGRRIVHWQPGTRPSAKMQLVWQTVAVRSYVNRRRQRSRCAPIVDSAVAIRGTGPYVSRGAFESLRTYVDARVIFEKTRRILTARACRLWKTRAMRSANDPTTLQPARTRISGEVTSEPHVESLTTRAIAQCADCVEQEPTEKTETVRDKSRRRSRLPLLPSVQERVGTGRPQAYAICNCLSRPRRRYRLFTMRIFSTPIAWIGASLITLLATCISRLRSLPRSGSPSSSAEVSRMAISVS